MRGLPKRDLSKTLSMSSNVPAPFRSTSARRWPDGSRTPPQVAMASGILAAVLGDWCARNRLTSTLVATSNDVKLLVPRSTCSRRQRAQQRFPRTPCRCRCAADQQLHIVARRHQSRGEPVPRAPVAEDGGQDSRRHRNLGGSCSRPASGGHWSSGMARARSTTSTMSLRSRLGRPRMTLRSRSRAGLRRAISTMRSSRQMVRAGRLRRSAVASRQANSSRTTPGRPAVKRADAAQLAQRSTIGPFPSSGMSHVRQSAELLARPFQAVPAVQLGGQPSPQRQQIADVVKGITNLRRRQRAIAATQSGFRPWPVARRGAG